MCAETELMSCLYNCMLPLTVLQPNCDTTEAPMLREGRGLESTPAGQIRSNIQPESGVLQCSYPYMPHMMWKYQLYLGGLPGLCSTACILRLDAEQTCSCGVSCCPCLSP